MVRIHGKPVEWRAHCQGVHRLGENSFVLGLKCSIVSDAYKKGIWHCCITNRLTDAPFTTRATWQAARRAVEVELKRRLAAVEVVL